MLDNMRVQFIDKRLKRNYVESQFVFVLKATQ